VKKLSLTLLVLLATGVVSARAATLSLFDYGLNIDGTITTPVDPVPGEVNLAAFDLTTGLGDIAVYFGGAGPHYMALFVDHEIDEAVNTFFNEYGDAAGTPSAGLSWEIDEPGFVFGDIYDNFLVGALDSSNGVPPGSEDDVSMALGWDFILNPGEVALINISVGPTAPAGGFYLEQTDPDSDASVFFSTRLNIRGGEAVPDGGSSVLLLGLALAGAAAFRLRR
jgi:hypothetical protein